MFWYTVYLSIFVHFCANKKFICLYMSCLSPVHFSAYKEKCISLYCRMSSVLDLDALITQQALREAIMDTEVATAKQRHQHILDYIQVGRYNCPCKCTAWNWQQSCQLNAVVLLYSRDAVTCLTVRKTVLYYTIQHYTVNSPTVIITATQLYYIITVVCWQLCCKYNAVNVQYSMLL